MRAWLIYSYTSNLDTIGQARYFLLDGWSQKKI